MGFVMWEIWEMGLDQVLIQDWIFVVLKIIKISYDFVIIYLYINIIFGNEYDEVICDILT